MKKILLIFVVTFLMILGSCERTPDGPSAESDHYLVKSEMGDIIPGQYVVLLKDGVTSLKSAKLSFQNAKVLMRSEMQKVLSTSEISEREPLQVYVASVEGFAVRLSENEANVLKNNPAILGVWPDRLFTLGKPENPGTKPATQVVPPGITKVGGGETYTGSNKVHIIDTGIDLDHPDLNVDAGSGWNFIQETRSADDDNGHGTHCAGIIAAIDNSTGVVGVAAGAKVVPVKVLNRWGTGLLSTVIAGVDFVVANSTPGDAVNMSLGGRAEPSLDNAVIKMGEKGLFVALSAGNTRGDANLLSPGRVEQANIYTVSACDQNGVWADFSSWGNPPIDFCAPGVDILSTYKGGKYATMSGTSMAAPHVCGVLLLTGGDPGFSGYVEDDPDNNPDPIVHR